MKFKRLIALNLIFVMLLSLFIVNVESIPVKAETKVEYILLGDSRTSGIGLSLMGLSNSKNTDHGTSMDSCYGQGTSGYKNVFAVGLGGWSINSSVNGKTSKKIYQDALDEVAKINGDKKATIIYNMGANGITGYANDIAYLKELKSKWDGKIYVAGVIPVTTKCTTIKQSQVDTFNTKMKEGASDTGYTYIECSDTIKKSFINDTNTGDGLHYSGTLYKTWFDDILSKAKGGSGTGDGDRESGGGISDEELKSRLGIGDNQLKIIKSITALLKGKGYSDAAIAGVVACASKESSLNPLSRETTTGNGGLFGFTPVSDFAKSEENKNCKHEKAYITNKNGDYTGTDKICADGACQVVYFMKNCEEGFKTWKFIHKNWNTFWDEYETSLNATTVKKIKDSDVYKNKIQILESWDEYKTITNPVDACIITDVCFERAWSTLLIQFWSKDFPFTWNGHKYTSRQDVFDWAKGASSGSDSHGDAWIKAFTPENTKIKTANAVYEWLGGNPTSPDKTTDDEKDAIKDIGQVAFEARFYSEKDLESFCELNEINIQEEFLNKAQFENLSDDEVHSLAQWQDQTQFDEEKPIVKTFRVIVMIIGILLTLWAILIYIAFWLDRFNNFIDIDFLPLLTLNKLRASESDETCSYGSKETADSAVRTVNHRTVIKIAVIMLGTGALMITGVIYKLVLWIINFVVGVFKK